MPEQTICTFLSCLRLAAKGSPLCEKCANTMAADYGIGVVSLIADLEAAEALADTWRGAHDACRSRMEADLATASKLIEALWKTVEGTFTDANINNIATLYADWRGGATNEY